MANGRDDCESGRALAALCAGVLTVRPACGGGGASDESGGDTTITWWHNSNNEPGKGYYEQVAKDFEADHPGVKIEISAMAHEDMVDKLDAAFQSGDIPDIYMERGGGELADHVEAGMVRDLSDDASDEIAKIGGSVAGWQVDGKTYALPFSLGVVGVWYNTDLFEQAGITAPPTTHDECYDVIDQAQGRRHHAALRRRRRQVAGRALLVLHRAARPAPRTCSQDAVTSLDFSDPCFVQAGEVLEDLLATEPFNAGFLTTPGPGGRDLGLRPARHRQGRHGDAGPLGARRHAGPHRRRQGPGRQDRLVPLPGRRGRRRATRPPQLGGGDAWAVSEEAPDEAVDFVKYLLSDEVQKGFAENDMGLPTNPAATGSVSDPALAELLKVRDAAPYVQLYFDTAFGASIGGAMNDEIALLFAGEASPQDVVDATQEAADQEK